MKLTNETLKTLILGAVRFEEQDDGFLSFHRFTEKQVAYYRDTNPDFYKKALASSNMRLSFETDASQFSFHYRAKKASGRNFFFFDLFVDGVMVEHCGDAYCTEKSGRVVFTLPEGKHLVTLYFPGLFSVALGNFEISKGATVTPVTRSRKLLMYGDSITQGYDAVYPSQSYANLVTDMLDAVSLNQAIGGEVFNPGIVDGDLGFTPDLITVAYGANDFAKRQREDMVRDANEFYRRVRAAFPTVRIFAILPIWRRDKDTLASAVGTFEEAKDIVRRAAEAQENVVVIDGNTFVPHLPEFFSDKRLHPNDLGFKFYADALYAAMMPHLKGL